MVLVLVIHYVLAYVNTLSESSYLSFPSPWLSHLPLCDEFCGLQQQKSQVTQVHCHEIECNWKIESHCTFRLSLRHNRPIQFWTTGWFWCCVVLTDLDINIGQIIYGRFLAQKNLHEDGGGIC